MSIKYRTSAGTSASNFTDLVVKVGDTLPIGTEVDYDGQTAPAGWQEVEETNLGDVVVDSIRTKNMFDSLKYSTTTAVSVLSNSNGTLELQGITGYYAGVRRNFNVKPNVTYTLSWFSQNLDTSVNTSLLVLVYKLDGTTQLTSNGNAGSQYVTFSTTESGVIIDFRVNGTTNIGHNKYSNIQLEEGSNATPYTPYQELNSKEAYSVNETRIGTWTNGKPLYRKVYTGTLTGETTNYNYAEFYLPTTIEALVRLNGSMKANNSNAHWVKSFPANTIDINYFYNEGTGRTRLYGTNKTEMPITTTSYIVIAEYTKTTD